MPERYYAQTVKDWTFIFLDGNDISLHAWPKDSDAHSKSVALYKKQYAHLKDWNGGIGQTQLNWLENQLSQADKEGKHVALFCHFPIYPETKYNLWNASQLRALLEKHSSVKAWFNGHQHSGNYASKNNIHYFTLKSMLDTKRSAYSLVDFSKNAIHIKGYGKQPDYQVHMQIK